MDDMLLWMRTEQRPPYPIYFVSNSMRFSCFFIFFGVWMQNPTFDLNYNGMCSSKVCTIDCTGQQCQATKMWQQQQNNTTTTDKTMTKNCVHSTMNGKKRGPRVWVNETKCFSFQSLWISPSLSISIILSLSWESYITCYNWWTGGGSFHFFLAWYHWTQTDNDNNEWWDVR